MPFPPCQIELSKLISGYYFKIQIHLSKVHIKRLVVSVQFDILIGLLVYFVLENFLDKTNKFFELLLYL